MFATRSLLGLGSIALGVAGFQAPAHAGNFSVNFSLGSSRPAVIVPAPVQASYYAPAPVYAQPVVQPQVIQPTYYTPSYYTPRYSPSYRLPIAQCEPPHHNHHHNIQQSNYWRGGYQNGGFQSGYSNYPYWR